MSFYNRKITFFITFLFCSGFIGCLDEEQEALECDEEKPVFEKESERIVVDYIYSHRLGEEVKEAYKLHMDEYGVLLEGVVNYDERFLPKGICDFKILEITETDKCVLNANSITYVHVSWQASWDVYGYHGDIYNSYYWGEVIWDAPIEQKYAVAKSNDNEGVWGVFPEDDFPVSYNCNEVGIQENLEYAVDSDSDGIGDLSEIKVYGTLPTNHDTDGDRINDYNEIFLYHTNPLSLDTDVDGIVDYDEISYRTNPLLPDTDKDGLNDSTEINEIGSDPLNFLGDADGDGVMDNIEILIYKTNPNNPDSDNDGLNDYTEIMTLSNVESNIYINNEDKYGRWNLNPNNPDTDGDGLSDGEELYYHQNNVSLIYSTNPSHNDSDLDGVEDYDEVYLYNTDPSNNDTDGDGRGDGAEIFIDETDPNDSSSYFLSGVTAADFDGDGINNKYEIYLYNTNSNNNDTDGDGINDYDEIFLYYTDPLLEDTDGDGINDYDEININNSHEDFNSGKLNPINADTDGDGINDYDEINLLGTNPFGSHHVECLFNPQSKIVCHDFDKDGLADNIEFFIYNTDPKNNDTDEDGVKDYVEILANLYSTNPLVEDSDGDGLSDYDETVTFSEECTLSNSDENEGGGGSCMWRQTGSCDDGGNNREPYNDKVCDVSIETGWSGYCDCDGDGVKDSNEAGYSCSSSPTNCQTVCGGRNFDPDSTDHALPEPLVEYDYRIISDSDRDGVNDGDESLITNGCPLNYDTDGDGLSDGEEVYIYETDPSKRDSDDDGVDDRKEIEKYSTDPNGNTDPKIFFKNEEGGWFSISHFYLPDADYDGVSDYVDNCPNEDNWEQYDSDYDGHGDVCDATPYGESSESSGGSSSNACSPFAVGKWCYDPVSGCMIYVMESGAQMCDEWASTDSCPMC